MMTIQGQATYESARIYHDFNSLNLLKSRGKDDNPEAIREAAKQFESIFLGMMLKSMRDASAAIINDPLFDSNQMGMYQDMYDEQLTVHLSTANSPLGLTDILVQQLTGNPSSDSQSKSSKELMRTNFLSVNRSIELNKEPSLAMLGYYKQANENPIKTEQIPSNVQPLVQTQSVQLAPQVTLEQPPKQNEAKRGLDFSSPSEFVQSLWPYAKQAAKLLQLDPKILIAQAALETGWGKYVMRTEQGDSSKNMFGIKADTSWQGESTRINTLEVESGSFSKKSFDFRTYKSYADSFADYANFIRGKVRYQKAMSVASRPDHYMQELQTAGYATDPDYAKKIGEIFYSPTLNKAINSLADNL